MMLSVSVSLYTLPVLADSAEADSATANDAPQDSQTLDEIKQALKHVESNLSNKNPIQGEIARAVFTHEIDGYDPIDEIVSISVKHHKVYFFTDLKDMKGEKIFHRWEYNNVVKANVEFDVKADRYRVHSSKNILPNETGEWTVVVTNQDGQVLSRQKITVVP